MTIIELGEFAMPQGVEEPHKPAPTRRRIPRKPDQVQDRVPDRPERLEQRPERVEQRPERPERLDRQDRPDRPQPPAAVAPPPNHRPAPTASGLRLDDLYRLPMPKLFQVAE